METTHNVLAILQKIAAGAGCQHNDISMETSLVDDLGFDSIMFMQLTVELEDALSLDSFPMQDWVELQRERCKPPFAVGDLMDFCAHVKSTEASLRGA